MQKYLVKSLSQGEKNRKITQLYLTFLIKQTIRIIFRHNDLVDRYGISKSHQCIEVKYLFYVRPIVSNANVPVITEIINKGIRYFRMYNSSILSFVYTCISIVDPIVKRGQGLNSHPPV
jgi:hypothetical protein